MNFLSSDSLPFLIGLAVGFLLGFFLYAVTGNGKSGRAAQSSGGRPERERWFSLQLQAYERIILFLERITLQNLLHREKPNGQTAVQYYLRLVQGVQREYDHNLTQQLYLPEKPWEQVEQVKNQVLQALSEVKPEAGPQGAQHFREAVITKGLEKDIPIKALIRQLKRELKKSLLPYL